MNTTVVHGKTRCRSCQAEIAWAQTTTGQRMPLDAEPVANGNLVVDEVLTPTLVLVRSYNVEVDGEDVARFQSHFASCPDGSHWRRRRG